MKAHEVTVPTAMNITGLDANGINSMLNRGVLHRVEKGETFIQRASLLDCYVKDRKAREAVENALGSNAFWDDVAQDLANPDFADAFVETSIQMNANSSSY